MNLQDKNIFMCNFNDKFTPLYIDALINRAGIDKTNFIAIILGNPQDFIYKKLFEYLSIEYMYYSDNIVNSLKYANTITFMSINNYNSRYIMKILKIKEILNKTYFIITDDEVDRWKTIYKKFGKLVVNKSMHVTKDVIEILNYPLNFIVPRKFFYEKLYEVLPNKNFNIIDASVIFDILPVKDSDRLFQIIENEMKFRNKEKILIGSKQDSFTYKEIIKILKGFVKMNLVEKYVFVCLNSMKNRIFIRLYQFYIRKIKKKNLFIEFYPQMDPIVYNTFITSIKFFILQRRGGASTARVFLKWGCGYLCVLNESDNYYVFKDIFNIELISLNKYEELSSFIFNSSNKINIQRNQKEILKEEKKSIKVLNELYKVN